VRRMAGSPAPSAVVTGAARGFGKEIARRLVARGHRVLITDVDAEAVAAAAAELGAGCTGIVADARSAADHRRAARAAAELGPVAAWVDNAGVLHAFSRPTLLTADAVADAAVALLAGRRIVRSLPPARGGLARIGGLLPVVGLPVLARLRARGERRRVAAP